MRNATTIEIDARRLLGEDWVERNRPSEVLNRNPNPMVVIHGPAPQPAECRRCRHYSYSPGFYNGTRVYCALRGPLNRTVRNADGTRSHRAGWDACGKFETPTAKEK